MEQIQLFPENQKKRKLTIDERFEIWIHENPKIVPLFLKFSRQVKESGREHYGIAAITERVRWEVWITLRDSTTEFRVNNNYRAPMARLLVKLDPSLSGLFAMRKRISLEQKKGHR